MVSTRENSDGDNYYSTGDNSSARRDKAAMRAPAKKALLNIIIAAGFGVMLLIGIYNSVQIQDQNEILIAQNDVIKEQTDINQRFIRCLILIPGGQSRTPEERIEAIDKCAIESRLPSGEPTSPFPTNEDRENFENQQKSDEEDEVRTHTRPKAQPPAEGANMQPKPESPDKPEPPEQMPEPLLPIFPEPVLPCLLGVCVL